jgi:hypothetical protein
MAKKYNKKKNWRKESLSMKVFQVMGHDPMYQPKKKQFQEQRK